jgi:hypothetical protein
MPSVSNDQLARIAATLGHTGLTVTPHGRYAWRATCDCGYESVNKRTPAMAASSAVHHLELVIKEWRASGAPLKSIHLDDSQRSETRRVI